MRKIAIFTSARSEYGLLKPLMRLIKNDPKVALQIIVSGMHLSPSYGETWKEIVRDGFDIDAQVEMLLSSDTPCGCC